MTEQSELWTSVKASYASSILISLTNIVDGAGTSIDDTVGTSAALEVINLWNMYAQIDYSSADATHVAVGRRGTIAVLWERGGTTAEVAQIKWDSIFGTDGIIARIRRTGPRARQGPSTNSNMTQDSGLSAGRRKRPWSDVESLPHNWMPSDTIARS